MKLVCVGAETVYVTGMEVSFIASAMPRMVDRPTAEEVIEAVHSLDGHRINGIWLINGDLLSPRENDPSMFVFGGNEGRYCCWVNSHPRGHFVLNRQSDVANSGMLAVSRPPDDMIMYHVTEIVDRATAVEAATAFALTGDLASRLNWVPDGV